MASFKIAALQKVLDGSVPLSELELANKQYNALTAKYRDMLQKDNLLVQRTTNMEHMEVKSVLPLSLKVQNYTSLYFDSAFFFFCWVNRKTELVFCSIASPNTKITS